MPHDLTPNEAGIHDYDTDHMHRPYYQSTTMRLAGLLIAGVLIFLFLSWAFSGSDDAVRNPGPNYEGERGDTETYNFFYNMFRGIDDGLDDHPQNLNNIEHLDDLNLDEQGMVPLDKSSLNNAQDPEDILREQFDGKILDYEGRPAGDIVAAHYLEDGEKIYEFSLKPELRNQDEPSLYTVPAKSVKVVQDGDIFYIQLNKAQTEALAEALYDDVE